MNTLPTFRESAAAAIASVIFAATAFAEDSRHFPLTSTAGLTPHHVTIRPATLSEKQGIRVEGDGASVPGANREELVVLDGVDFADGVIEAEIAGDVRPGAAEGARGFVGIAFRVQKDLATYDAFYLRPTNGRADDQLRRNHSAQYISHPQWTWSRLRNESPGKYESYVDLVPGQWTKVRIEVSGSRARLYVHGNEQPTLIVNDLKSGATSGSIALWLDVGTLAHFRDVRFVPQR